MKQTIDELLATVYRYYPRGISRDDARFQETEEHRRLVVARRGAAEDDRWHALLQRVSERCPSMLMNRSLHLPTGEHDACYSFTLSLPGTDDRQVLWFSVSFLVPCYVVYSWRLREDEELTRALHAKPLDAVRVKVEGLCFSILASALAPDFLSELQQESEHLPPVQREDIVFELSPDEQRHAGWISRDIEATFGCERMPPEVGTFAVPDVATGSRLLGEATLYDCLFSDENHWVKAKPPEVEKSWMWVEASRMPAPILSALTVLGAFHLLNAALNGIGPLHGFIFIETDGVLHKEGMLDALAVWRPQAEAPADQRAKTAARELEALLVAWDGKGAPPDAVVAWASGFLRHS